MPRLELGDGKWIDVRDKLKVKDNRDVHTYSDPGVSADGQTYRYNLVKNQIATAAVRITGWNVEDERGKPIVWPAAMTFKDKVAAIELLDEDQFNAINAALETHDKARTADAVKEKNAIPDGETNSEATSPSVNT